MEDPIKIIGVTEVCNQIADIYRKKMDAAGYDKNGELYNFKWTTEWKDNFFEVYFDDRLAYSKMASLRFPTELVFYIFLF